LGSIEREVEYSQRNKSETLGDSRKAGMHTICWAGAGEELVAEKLQVCELPAVNVYLVIKWSVNK
jgi:hypothetical protein